jgi:hypothetical protein
MTCAFVPAVGQGRHFIRVIPQHRQDVEAYSPTVGFIRNLSNRQRACVKDDLFTERIGLPHSIHQKQAIG